MMSPLGNAIILGLFGLPPLVLIAYYVFCSSYSELVAVYLITVWLQTYAYGLAWILSGTDRLKDPRVLSLVAGLLIIYFLGFIFFGTVLTKYYGLIARVALKIPESVIVGALSVWLVFMALLVRKYGLLALGSLKFQRIAGVPNSLMDVDALLLILAMGAFVTYTIQVARNGRRAIHLLPAGLWVAFGLVNMLSGGTGVGKRMMILMVLVGLLMLPDRRFRLSASVVFAVVIGILAVAFLGNRFQAIRQNFPALRSEVAHVELGKALAIIFKPTPHHLSLFQEIAERPPPIDLIYQITDRQLNGRGVAGGRLIKQVILDNVPAVLLSKKTFVGDDDITADFFNMPHIDYATTPLEEIQTECFLSAYVFVPAMYAALLWMYLALLDRYQSQSWMFSVALIGVLVITAGSFEYGLSEVVRDVRDIGILWCVSVVLLQFTRLRVLSVPPGAAQQAD